MLSLRLKLFSQRVYIIFTYLLQLKFDFCLIFQGQSFKLFPFRQLKELRHQLEVRTRQKIYSSVQPRCFTVDCQRVELSELSHVRVAEVSERQRLLDEPYRIDLCLTRYFAQVSDLRLADLSLEPAKGGRSDDLGDGVADQLQARGRVAVRQQLRVELCGVHSVEEAVDLSAQDEFDDPVASRVLCLEVRGVVGVVAEDDVLVCEFVEGARALDFGTEEPFGLRIGDFGFEFGRHSLDEDVGDDATELPEYESWSDIRSPPANDDVDFVDDCQKISKCLMQIPDESELKDIKLF